MIKNNLERSTCAVMFMVTLMISGCSDNTESDDPEDCLVVLVERFNVSGDITESLPIDYDEKGNITGIMETDYELGMAEIYPEEWIFTYEEDRIVRVEYSEGDHIEITDIFWENGKLISLESNQPIQQCTEYLTGTFCYYYIYRWQFEYENDRVVQIVTYYDEAENATDLDLKLNSISDYSFENGNVIRIEDTFIHPIDSTLNQTFQTSFSYDGGINPFYNELAWWFADGSNTQFLSRNNLVEFEGCGECSDSWEYDKKGRLLSHKYIRGGRSGSAIYTYSCN